MDYEADEAGNIFAGLANASDPWYTVKNDAWVVNTNGSGSQAFAETFQELIDNKATLTTRVGCRRSTHPCRMAR